MFWVSVVTDAWKRTVRNLREFRAILMAPLLLSVLVLLASFLVVANTPTPLLGYGIGIASAFVCLFLGAWFSVSWLQFLLGSDKRNLSIGALQFGETVRAMWSLVTIFLGLGVIGTVVLIGASLFVQQSDVGATVWNAMVETNLSWVVIGCFLAALVYVGARLLPVPLGVAIAMRPTWSESWEATRGHGLNLMVLSCISLTAGACISMPFGVAFLLFSHGLGAIAFGAMLLVGGWTVLVIFTTCMAVLYDRVFEEILIDDRLHGYRTV